MMIDRGGEGEGHVVGSGRRRADAHLQGRRRRRKQNNNNNNYYYWYT